MTYSRGQLAIGVGILPGRKKPCLYIGNEYCIHQVASFKNEEAAEEFTLWLEFFLGLRGKPLEDGENEGEGNYGRL